MMGASHAQSANATKFGLDHEHLLSKRTSPHSEVGSAKTEGFSRSTGFEAGIKYTF
jgi:hypothetical protein